MRIAAMDPKNPPNLSRDDWMVVGRGLQDRVEVLRNTQGFEAGPLRQAEVEKCERLRKMIDAHVDATWRAPKAAG